MSDAENQVLQSLPYDGCNGINAGKPLLKPDAERRFNSACSNGRAIAVQHAGDPHPPLSFLNGNDALCIEYAGA